jgi:hypothetical protein
MRFVDENRRGVILVSGVLAFVLGMPEILRAGERSLAPATPSQVTNVVEPSGSSEDDASAEQGRRRGWCSYYYPRRYYYFQPVYYYPVVVGPVVTYPVATAPTVAMPAYRPSGMIVDGQSSSNGSDRTILERGADGLKTSSDQ